ncbi:MAG: hypothetical protein GY850_29195 [bacterium]|nr:hypothetical protein [bacterium]
MSEATPAEASINARLWMSDSSNRKYEFAEQTYPDYDLMRRTPNTGICFSGGGTRALTAAMGQLRGLGLRRERGGLDLMKNVRYISCVSGGSWASTAYTYYNSGPQDDQVFLGPVTAPQDATWQALGELDPNCLGHTATQSLRNILIDLADKVPEHLLWISAIGEIFFQPFGIYDRTVPAGFTLNGASEDDIKNRNTHNGKLNPALEKIRFHKVRDPGDYPRPYLIINASLIGPKSLAPFKREGLVATEFTPLYTGTPLGREVTYNPESGKKTSAWVGGGYVEPFAFGGGAPIGRPFDCSRAAPPSLCAQVPAPPKIFRLADASGASSAAFAGYIETRSIFKDLGLKNLSPEESCWPIRADDPVSATTFMLGDGGILDNYGLIALLRRQVENIIVFINTDAKLDLSLDATPPADPPANWPNHEKSRIDYSLAPLFGFPYVDDGISMIHNRVFAQADFKAVVANLQCAKNPPDNRDPNQPAVNGTVMAKTSLRVQTNDWWGISDTLPDQSPYRVTILWVYNERVREWENALNPGKFEYRWLDFLPVHLTLKEAIKKGNEASPWGPFKHFPNYRTMEEDGVLDLVELSPRQVNLLADLSCWNVTRNKNVFEQMLPETAYLNS